MRYICRCLPLFCVLLVSTSLAIAQSSFDVNLGFGSTHVKSNGSGIDNASSSNAFGGCSLSAGDPLCQATPALSGFFLGLGGDIMLQKHYGFGAEVNLQPAQSSYGPLQYRQTFYDFNGIYAPINQKRVQVEFQGGIGGAKTSFSLAQNSCVGTAVCTNFAQPIGSANHFQVHVGAGVQFFMTEHIFIRPQFDLHYVPNFTEQFGSNAVPVGTIWVGYSFGER